MNGVKFSGFTAGAPTDATSTTTIIISAVSTNCTQPARRTPSKFRANGATYKTSTIGNIAERESPSTATMYSAPMTDTIGRPVETPK
ncbi:unannotated protein [freshwater metagenome]|uniref:Unannotated protein n=1 Tax=freshwater metagenome TaxID=449393 RepID=A0A6J6DJW5_9ZZZZ